VRLKKKIEGEDNEKGYFILVQCKGKKMSHYVAQVLSASIKYYEVKYLKKMTKSDSIVLDEDTELYSLLTENILCKLLPPVSLGKSKRKMNQVNFQVNFCCFNMG
jgi:hypothetical protein